MTSGTSVSISTCLEALPGLGLSCAQFGDHFAQIFLVYAAELLQALKVAGRDQVEIRKEALHEGVVAVFLLELQRQALGQVAGANSWRIEGLERDEDAFDLLQVSMERAVGNIFERGADIAVASTRSIR